MRHPAPGVGGARAPLHALLALTGFPPLSLGGDRGLPGVAGDRRGHVFQPYMEEYGYTPRHGQGRTGLLEDEARPPLPAAPVTSYTPGGDGESGMYPQRHLLRFATYAWLAFCAASPRGRRMAAPTAAAAAMYAGRRCMRIPSFMEGRPAREQAAAVPCISLLMLAIDGAKMAGYVAGLARRKRR